MERIIFVRLDKVLGMLYLPSGKLSYGIIHAKGGPSFGDSGESFLWPIAKKYNAALFVPDYIGYCRSYGVFNFRNCVETLYEVDDFLRGKRFGINNQTGKAIKINCPQVVLMGSSWGGAIVPFIEKYKKTAIEHIVLVKPVTDWPTQGKTKDPEEKTEQTDEFLKRGWKNVYRGYSESEWPQILKGKLKEFNPKDNLNLLKGKHVYIAHGLHDEAINWKKSQKYYQLLKNSGMAQSVSWKLFNDGHSSQMNARGLNYALQKITTKEINTIQYLSHGNA